MDNAAVLAKSMVTWVHGSGFRGIFTAPTATPGAVPFTAKLPNTQYCLPAWAAPAARDRFGVLAWLMESKCASDTNAREVPEYRYTRPAVGLGPSGSVQLKAPANWSG